MKTPEYLCPLLTAFTRDGSLDQEANRASIDRVVAAGLDGILLLGSSGEFFAMPEAMRRQLVEQLAPHAAGRTKVLVGTGCNSVGETVEASRHALDHGADGVMVISPYYFALGPDDLYTHYASVADQVDGPVYLYNYPARTGNDLDATLVARLVIDHPNIVGIKDTVTDMGHTRAIIEVLRALGRDDFAVYSGMDENFVHNVLAGGNGCIAALTNVAPREVAAWVQAVRADDLAGIERGQRAINLLSGLYSVAPSFVPVMKHAMARRGCPIDVAGRASLAAPTSAQLAAADAILDAFTSAYPID